MTTRDEHWLLQPQTRRLLGFAAVISLTLFALTYLILVVGRVIGVEATQSFLDIIWVKAFLVLLGVAGAPTALVLWLSMCWFWIRFDHSSKRSKTLWFLVVFLANWLGAPFYYFFVYRRATSA